jgi:hypothetical protein
MAPDFSKCFHAVLKLFIKAKSEAFVLEIEIVNQQIMSEQQGPARLGPVVSFVVFESLRVFTNRRSIPKEFA